MDRFLSPEQPTPRLQKEGGPIAGVWEPRRSGQRVEWDLFSKRLRVLIRHLEDSPFLAIE